MKSKTVYRTYKTKGDLQTIHDEIVNILLSRGFIKTGTSESGKVDFFKYPSLFFSSKKPLTCISKLSLETIGNSREIKIIIGMTFTKIRNFTVFIIFLLVARVRSEVV